MSVLVCELCASVLRRGGGDGGGAVQDFEKGTGLCQNWLDIFNLRSFLTFALRILTAHNLWRH